MKKIIACPTSNKLLRTNMTYTPRSYSMSLGAAYKDDNTVLPAAQKELGILRYTVAGLPNLFGVPRKLSQVRKSSTTYMFFESPVITDASGAIHNLAGYGAGGTGTYGNNGMVKQAIKPYNISSHADKGRSFAYVDGHVEYILPGKDKWENWAVFP